MLGNNDSLQPWDEALAILAAIIAEKHLANDKNTEFHGDKTCTSENEDVGEESSHQQN
jgi:hypothetical protein